MPEFQRDDVVTIDGYATKFTIDMVTPQVVTAKPVDVTGYPYDIAYRRGGWDFQVAKGFIRPA